MNAIFNIFFVILMGLWAVSWTNALSDTYNWWGFMVWAGETFK
jgi:hypothetical protein